MLATPCQTPDSLTLVTEVDGQRIAFTGDLIARPGQVWDFGELQWSYLQYEGLQALPASLETVRLSKPDLLCPSHGDVMDRPEVALAELAFVPSEWLASSADRPSAGGTGRTWFG